MTIKELTYLFQNPSLLKEDQIHALEKISTQFPYFQSIRSLNLKGLKDRESFRYNQELKITAAYTTDRSVLFNYITSPSFLKEKEDNIPQKKEQSEITVIAPEEVKTLARISIDDALSMKLKDAEDVLDPSLFASKEPEKNKTSEKKTEQDPKEQLGIDKPLNFNKKETHSFAEWLKIIAVKPIDRGFENEETKQSEQLEASDTEEKISSSQKNTTKMIDNFIINNPKIKPADKNSPFRNLAKEHVVAPDELMTETLAKVYLSQKKYKKAIQAYKILILKNPEKSGFFADQIRAVEKLQENK